MGKRFNQFLRLAAAQGIPVGTAAQAAQTFTSGRIAAGKPVGKPARAVHNAMAGGITDTNTLSNIANASNPGRAANQGLQRASVMTDAINQGVHPVAAAGLGAVKNIGKAIGKTNAGIRVAQAGGDIQSQIDVMMGKNPGKKADLTIPGITEAYNYGQEVQRINRLNEENANNPIKGDDEYIQQGGAFDGGKVKDGGAAFRRRRRRRGSSNPQSSANSQSVKITNSNINANPGGINA